MKEKTGPMILDCYFQGQNLPAASYEIPNGIDFKYLRERAGQYYDSTKIVEWTEGSSPQQVPQNWVRQYQG